MTTENKKYIADFKILKKKKFINIWTEDWKDELIIFINDEDKIKIFSSICPHFGGEIKYDSINAILKCSWHDWKFCPKTGSCLSYPIKGKLNPYDFEINPNDLKSYEYHISDKKIYAIKKND